MPNTLGIKNVSKMYPNGTKALQSINLTISNGMFGLLGPNGAGKSSLMRSIACLQHTDSGKILFNSSDIAVYPEHIKSCLGYLPQEFGVLPGLSATELLDHIAILKGVMNKNERTEQINALLQHTNLYQHRNKAVSTFSGGMKQRFGIAQALLGNPKIIIVDEPTAGLDPEERNRLHNLLNELSADRIIFLSTHIVEDVRDLCTEMAILNGGKIIEKGNPSTLLNKISDKVWQKVISPKDVLHYKNKLNVISTRLFEGNVHIHVYSESAPDSSFSNIQPDLEDVYFTHLFGYSRGENYGK